MAWQAHRRSRIKRAYGCNLTSTARQPQSHGYAVYDYKKTHKNQNLRAFSCETLLAVRTVTTAHVTWDQPWQHAFRLAAEAC
jgi:hypothetical protein